MNLCDFFEAYDKFKAQLAEYGASHSMAFLEAARELRAQGHAPNPPDPNEEFYDAVRDATNNVASNPTDPAHLTALLNAISALSALPNPILKYNPSMITYINEWQSTLTRYQNELPNVPAEILMREWSLSLIKQLKRLYGNQNWYAMIEAAIQTARTNLTKNDKPAFTFTANELVDLRNAYQLVMLLSPRSGYDYRAFYLSIAGAQTLLASLLERTFSKSQVDEFSIALAHAPTHEMNLRPRADTVSDEENSSAKRPRR